MLRIIFATIALLYGTTLAIATFAWQQPWLQVLHSEHALPITFLVSVVFFFPFVVTFTNLGLNTPEDEKPTPETKRRLAELSKECRMWPVAWYGTIGFIGVSWLVFFVSGGKTHPFLAFSAGVSLISGLWLAFVYPTAKRLFENATD